MLSGLRWGKLAYYKDILIAAVTCKTDLDEDDDEAMKDCGVYLMTVTVLKPYRRYGLATKLVNLAMNHYKEVPDIKFMFLDV